MSDHLRMPGCPAGEVDGHHLIVPCVHAGMVVAGMSAKDSLQYTVYSLHVYSAQL